MGHFLDSTLTAIASVQTFCLPQSKSVLEGISLAQRKVHISTLTDLLNLLADPEARCCQHMSLPLAFIHLLGLMKQKRRWGSPTTLLGKASSLMGALKRLPQYAPGLRPVNLMESCEWQDAMKNWSKKATAHLPVTSEANLAQVKRVLSRTYGTTRLLLLIGWIHAARVGNIYTLETRDLSFTREQDGYRFAIIWFRAKTSAVIGAYTTHSWISEEHYNFLQEWIRSRPSEGWLLPDAKDPSAVARQVSVLREQLRLEDPKFDLRSLRRGALQALARSGVDLEVVRVFSGHTNLPQLLRYLGRGLAAGGRSMAGADAAKRALRL